MPNGPAVRALARVLACTIRVGIILVAACNREPDGDRNPSASGAGAVTCAEIGLQQGMTCEMLAVRESVVVEGGNAKFVVLSASAGSDTLLFTRDTALAAGDSVVVEGGTATMRLSDSVVVEGGNRTRTIVSSSETGSTVIFLRQAVDSLL